MKTTNPPLPPRVRWTWFQATILTLTIIYSILLLCLLEFIRRGPDYNPFTFINLYLPQIFWGIPALFLIPILALSFSGKRRRLALLPLLPLGVVLGPLMGLCGYPRLKRPSNQVELGKSLRVMTYNIGQGKDGEGVISEVARQHPDVFIAQEISEHFEQVLRTKYPKWSIQTRGEFLIATPLMLSSVDRVELPQLSDDPWKHPAYLRSIVRFGQRDIAIYNTHLSTPRPALEAIRYRDRTGFRQIESNAKSRIAQSKTLANALAKESLPAILGGDFNAPESSIACRQIRDVAFRDAFSETGRGYGYTSGHRLRFGISFVRIDHLYVSHQWAVTQCYPGDKVGSDHRPVVADVVLPDRIAGAH
jgi:vancomycin resistance protein VanJ